MSHGLESLLERMNEIVKALTKQLADKNDTKKALKLLEKQVVVGVDSVVEELVRCDHEQREWKYASE